MDGIVQAAHIDDVDLVAALVAKLRQLHGPTYDFGVSSWCGETSLRARTGTRRHTFVVSSANAMVRLQPGELVRGADRGMPAIRRESARLSDLYEVSASVWTPLMAGDVLVVDGDGLSQVHVCGKAMIFDVITEPTAYPAPRVVLLRNLDDIPGGCAAYPGAFRREALPPVRGTDPHDRRGVNRVNEHTLDMRSDRIPQPGAHHHGPVTAGDAGLAPHSEIAIVLPRSLYNLPATEPGDRLWRAASDQGLVELYCQPQDEPATYRALSVCPGSLVLTHAGLEAVAGHRFVDAFAMLIAVPGFVSPHVTIGSGL